MNTRSLLFKSILLLNGLIIIVILFTNIVNYISIRSTLIQDLRNRKLEVFLNASVSNIKGEIEKAIESSLVLANDPLLIEWFKGGETNDSLAALLRIKFDYLTDGLKYASISATSEKTKKSYYKKLEVYEVISLKDPDDNWYYDFLESKKKVEINFDHNEVLKQSMIFINALIGDAANPIGACGVVINPDLLLDDLFSNSISLNSFITIVDDNGEVRISQNINDVHKNMNAIYPKEVVGMVLGGDDKGVLSDVLINSEMHEVVFSTFVTAGHKVILAAPKDELMAILLSLRKNSAIVIVVFIAMALVPGILIIQRIINPIKRLEKYSERFYSEGAKAPEISGDLVQRKDEIGHLAKAFDNMSQRIISIINEKEQVYSKLLESDKRFKLLLNLATEGIVIHKNGEIIDINPAAEKLSGYAWGDLETRNMVDAFVPREYKAVLKRKINEDETGPYEIAILRKDGTTIPVQIETHYISRQENVKVSTIRDISFQKKQNKDMIKVVISAEEEERKRIAQDLHDGIGPLLSAAKLSFQMITKTQDKAYRKELFEQAVQIIDETIASVSSISNNLMPGILESFGLCTAVRRYAESIGKASELTTKVSCPFNVKLKEVLEVTLYRIICELLNNTIKYSKATLAEIELNIVGDFVQLKFRNNGESFDFFRTIKEKKGLGLRNIVNRVESLSGVFQFESSDGNGVFYSIKLPISL
jgi:PAS domain S-box-containing protein